MSKNPKVKIEPQVSKTPKKAGFDEDPMRLKPAWRIGRMEFCDPWGWHEMRPEDWTRIQERLKAFESMTLGEMIGKQNHLIPVEQLCKEAERRLVELRLDDVTSLFSLRITKIERVWAVLEHNVAILLWWDPEHQVYPMNVTDN